MQSDKGVGRLVGVVVVEKEIRAQNQLTHIPKQNKKKQQQQRSGLLNCSHANKIKELRQQQQQ